MCCKQFNILPTLLHGHKIRIKECRCSHTQKWYKQFMNCLVLTYDTYKAIKVHTNSVYTCSNVAYEIGFYKCKRIEIFTLLFIFTFIIFTMQKNYKLTRCYNSLNNSHL